MRRGSRGEPRGPSYLLRNCEEERGTVACGREVEAEEQGAGGRQRSRVGGVSSCRAAGRGVRSTAAWSSVTCRMEHGGAESTAAWRSVGCCQLQEVNDVFTENPPEVFLFSVSSIFF